MVGIVRCPPKLRQLAKSGFCSYNEIDQGRMNRKRSEAGSLAGLSYPGERQPPARRLRKMAKCDIPELVLLVSPFLLVLPWR